MEIKSIIESLGYKLSDDGSEFWRAKPLYRDSGNSTSLRISKRTGSFKDFSANLNGTLKRLIQITLNIKDSKSVEKWLDGVGFIEAKQNEDAPKIINYNKSWSAESLERLVKNHSYWINRGITEDTLKLFKGGVATSDKMIGRYVFPIFCDKNENRVIGFVGRDLSDKNPIKYKIIGSKSKFKYPLFLNRNYILEKKTVILVEGIGCVLKLWDFNIKNSLCLFGTSISDSLICSLCGLNLNQIIIATNNEESKIGNDAAVQIKERLSKFFNENKIKIELPPKKDFAECSDAEINDYIQLNNL